jgi:hypothetical protein
MNSEALPPPPPLVTLLREMVKWYPCLVCKDLEGDGLFGSTAPDFEGKRRRTQ